MSDEEMIIRITTEDWIELLHWREFKSICNSREDKNGRDMKPVRITLSSVRVMKTKRLNELLEKLGLEIDK